MSKVREGYKITELGEIPSEWEVKYLKEICEFMNGKAHEDIVDDNGDYILINSKFVSTEGAVSKRVTKNISPLLKDDIAIVMSDIPKGKAFAKCFLVEKDNKYTLNQRIGLIRTNSLVPKYLFYQLNRNAYFLKFDDGVSQTNIRKPDLLQCPVLIPTYKEQQKIASILSTVDEQIDETEQLIVKTKELKKGLMQQLLTKGIGHTEFKQTELGEIPVEWEFSTLEKVCYFSNGKAHEEFVDENGEYILINSKFISTEGEVVKKTNALLMPLEENDIAIVMSDVPNGKAFAKCFLVPEADKYTLNQRIGLIRTDSMYSKFLFYQVNRNSYFLSFDNGVGQTNIRKADLLACPILVPPIEEQQKIASFLSKVDEQIEVYEQEKAKYEELKKGLMQQLLTGKIRVKI
ncbi:restriction endonuclease subunit S [Lysinibacillus boronitolerans]|uniref:restriction endonuclease subunit S n=1 Tax=Lysinibacillus boronitolerans TaxID=309788 RepID=UPI003855662B